MNILPKLNRRAFLKGAVVAAAVPSPLAAVAANTATPDTAAAGWLISDFVRVSPDNKIIVVVKHVEAGQGPATGLATLVAEEMNADWKQVEVVFAPANSKYANLLFGFQGTGGSTAMANSFAQYRKAGAQVLSQLTAAAAQKWNVTPESVRAEDGFLFAGDKRASYGEMASAAAKLPPVTEPTLKNPSDFRHIGKPDHPRKDIGGKINGTAQYAMDIHPTNPLYVLVARPPKFGGVLSSFDDSAARQVSGYVGARQIPSGIAVYADSFWGAEKARRAIKSEWDFSQAETRSSAKMLADYQKALDGEGIVFRNDGDAAATLAGAHKTVEAEFFFPFLAHAPMETLNCVIEKRGDNITLWDGCQVPGTVQGAIGAVFELPPEQVNIVSQLAGGTFGRRATPTNDYQMEAAHALKKSPAPARAVKLMWTREDDIQGGYYRPMFVHRARAGIDQNGNIVAWTHALAGKSIAIGTLLEAFAVNDGVDNTSVEGVSDMPYRVGDMYADVRNMETPVTVLWWRSVGHSHTAFAKETMMNMLAEAANEDPVAFRLRHLDADSRSAGVLRAVAKAAEWDKPAKPGVFRGVALHESFDSYVAEVLEASLVNGAIKVNKVTCAVDCGVAVNPDIIRAQMESGVGYGLGAAMRNQITFADGGLVQQTNFPNYQPLRMADMPEVNTVIVASGKAPTGVGEPGLPPIAPALGAAIYAATGKRINRLPFAAHGVRFA